ncbi:hypothetical protein ScPMuIL_017198 [Solemya velum]
MSGLQRPPPGGGSGRPGGGAQQMKLVLLGDQGVGKSSLALRFVRGDFREDQEATIGAAFLTQTVNVQGKNIKFDIWDTAGQERYHSLAPMYYRGAQAAIVVYDITSTHSFEQAHSWVKELQKETGPDVIIALAGNKVDMAAETRAVMKEEAEKYAMEHGLFHLETSAKTGYNVQNLFQTLAQEIIRNDYVVTQTRHRIVTTADLLGEQSYPRRRTCCS